MKKNKILLFILILLSLLPLKELLIPGLYQSHDIMEHAARLSSFYQSLAQGNLIPHWGGNLNFGYGHPVLMFLYPLTNYLGSFFHLLGFSIADSLKILFAVSYIASGIFMFFWIKRLWGEKAGFISAVFYLFASYRLVDLYVRASLGEHLAFVFIPFLCWMITELVKTGKKKYLSLSSLGVALLILAHNAISLMFAPFIFIYGLFLFYRKKKGKILPWLSRYIVIWLIGLGLSAFFWLPSLMEGKYTLREIVTDKGVFSNNYLKPTELFFSKWGYGLSGFRGLPVGFKVSLDWFEWLVIIVSVGALFYKKTKDKAIFGFLLAYLFLALFFTTNLSEPFTFLVPLIYRFQFPWRLLAVPVLICSLLAGYLVFSFFRKVNFSCILIFSFIVVFSTIPFWKIQGTEVDSSDEFFLNKYHGTTETGESTPIWAIRFQEDYPDAKVQLVFGGLNGVVIEKWDFEEHRYRVNVREDSQIADNTLYFPGWTVTVDDNPVPIKYQDINWRGIITYPVPTGEHQIVVKFTSTKVRLVGELISLISLIGLISLIIFHKNEK